MLKSQQELIRRNGIAAERCGTTQKPKCWNFNSKQSLATQNHTSAKETGVSEKLKFLLRKEVPILKFLIEIQTSVLCPLSVHLPRLVQVGIGALFQAFQDSQLSDSGWETQTNKKYCAVLAGNNSQYQITAFSKPTRGKWYHAACTEEREFVCYHDGGK
jgi:hypothetical protein